MSDSQYSMGRDFFDDEETAGRGNLAAGRIGAYGLHAVKAMFLLYSAYHGIHASLNYAGADELGRAAQIIGIIVLETVLASIYLAWHNQRITGDSQQIAAIVTYSAGFLMACLAIVADSQLNAGISPPPWMVAYLQWFLPISPAFMAAGAVLIHELAPGQIRRRQQSAAAEAMAATRFAASIARQRAELEATRQIANVALNARHAVARQIAESYSSPAVQAAIRNKALESLPALMAGVGIAMPGDGGESSQNGAERPSAAAERPSAAIVADSPGEASPRPFGANGGQP